MSLKIKQLFLFLLFVNLTSCDLHVLSVSIHTYKSTDTHSHTTVYTTIFFIGLHPDCV
jgi:hypothetical protein